MYSTGISASPIFCVKRPLPLEAKEAMNRRIWTMLSALKRHSSSPDAALTTEKAQKFLSLGSLLRVSTRIFGVAAVNECNWFLPSSAMWWDCDPACVWGGVGG